MATFAVVGSGDLLGTLVKLSLQSHKVPVTEVFDLFDSTPEGRYIGVVTPLFDEEGLHEAYMRVFTALQDETFALQSFIKLHTLVLSSDDMRDIRRVLKKGVPEANLSRLAQLRDVVIRPVKEAKHIQRSGILHVVAARGGSFQISFGDFGSSGAMKPRMILEATQLEGVFHLFDIRGSRAADAMSDLQKVRNASIPVTCTLETLYLQGLI